MQSNSSMFFELLRLGVRNVGRNRRRSLITGSMIAIAVTGIIFFRGYALGIERVLVDIAVEGLVGALQVQRVGYFDSQDLGPLDLDLPEDAEVTKQLLAIDNVAAVAPRVVFTGLISNGDESTMFVGLGIDPKAEPAVSPLSPGAQRSEQAQGRGINRLVEGAALSEVDENSVVLTDALATALKVKIGDSLVLLARTRNGSMDSVDLNVKGIFHYDEPLGNRQFGVIPLAVAQRLLHMEHRATAFTISVNDRQLLDATVAAVRDALSTREPAVAVFSWAQLAPYYRDVANLQSAMLDIIFFVVALIVLAGIANTMMMSTFERKREIGTLMSMGFRRKAIMVLFIIESVWLAALGALFGALFGVALVLLTHSTGIDFAIPAGGVVMTRPELRFSNMAVAVIGAMVCAMIAALLPAYRASRLKPIEALRSD